MIIAIIDSIAMKNNLIIIPFSLQKQIIDQLHRNYIGIEMMWLLARESVYWIKFESDI